MDVTTLTEHYSRVFSPELLYGLKMIINIGTSLVVLWLFALAYLVWRANSKSPQNRFIATLLTVEAFKCFWLALEIFPWIHEWNSFWVIAWRIKFDFFFSMQIAAIFLYMCFPIYYKIRGLGFMFRASLQKHAWYLPLGIGIAMWLMIQDLPPFAVNDLSWVECTAQGATPVVYEFLGSSTSPVVQSRLDGIGTICPAAFEQTVGDEPNGIWAIVFAQTPVSIVALLFIRSSVKKNLNSEEVEGEAQVSRSFYIGFLGKVIGSTMFFITLIVLLPILNGGVVPGFQDEIMWRYAERTFMSRFKYFLFTLCLSFGTLGLAFEAMMFVHASLKDSVFGIDHNLRKTFRNAVFTGIGAFLFILASEVMENVLGFGLAGGVVIGLGFLVVRKPIIGLIDGVSGQLIPSEYTIQEMEYLKAYSESIVDGKISERERSLLVTLASAYGIDEDRVREIEASFSDENSESIIEEVQSLEVIQQWTDDTGFTWRKMSDESMQWWNGTEWIEHIP